MISSVKTTAAPPKKSARDKQEISNMDARKEKIVFAHISTESVNVMLRVTLFHYIKENYTLSPVFRQ